MKREILFKGIVIDESTILFGEWFYGDLIQYVDGTVYIRQVQTNSMLQVNPETVCQFTGLLDKNGNKIFEGDILKHTYKNDVGGKVSFFQGSFIVGTAISSNSLINFNTCNYLEIIGNIHD